MHGGTSQPEPGSAREFATTHWSVVLAAGNHDTPDAQAALERLCQVYWPPLYAYLRRFGCSPEDAQDLTQDFFAHFLKKEGFSRAEPRRGRFPTCRWRKCSVARNPRRGCGSTLRAMSSPRTRAHQKPSNPPPLSK